MKMLPLFAAALAVTPLLANSAPLQQGTTYAGLNYALLELSSDAPATTDAEPTAFVGKLGHFLLDQIAVEGRLGLGVTSDTVAGVDYDMDRLLGAYLTGYVPLGEQITAYALVGVTEARFSASGITATTDSGFTWGFGADLYASPKFAINAEYTRYLDETGYSFSAVSIGARLP